MRIAIAVLISCCGSAAWAADLGIIPDAPPAPPVETGAVMFSPATTSWPQLYEQTYIVQQPVPGINVYEYDDDRTVPSIVLVVPPVYR